MSRLIVIPGAGASFDCAPRDAKGLRPEVNSEWQPPLTRQLPDTRFGEILESYPLARHAGIERFLAESQDPPDTRAHARFRQIPLDLQHLFWIVSHSYTQQPGNVQLRRSQSSIEEATTVATSSTVSQSSSATPVVVSDDIQDGFNAWARSREIDDYFEHPRMGNLQQYVETRQIHALELGIEIDVNIELCSCCGSGTLVSSIIAGKGACFGEEDGASVRSVRSGNR